MQLDASRRTKFQPTKELRTNERRLSRWRFASSSSYSRRNDSFEKRDTKGYRVLLINPWCVFSASRVVARFALTVAFLVYIVQRWISMEKKKKKKGRAEEKEKGEQTEAGSSPRRPASSLISSLAFSPSFFLFSVFSLSLLYFFFFTFVCLFGRRDSDFSNTTRVAILGRVVGDREKRVFPGNRFETWREQ